MIPDDVLEAVGMAFDALFNQQCDTRCHEEMEIYYQARATWDAWLAEPPTPCKWDTMPDVAGHYRFCGEYVGPSTSDVQLVRSGNWVEWCEITGDSEEFERMMWVDGEAYMREWVTGTWYGPIADPLEAD